LLWVVYRKLTLNNPGIMGWLARVPSVEECPTGHRYLRSLCCTDTNDNIYLGGPISLANFDEVDRVECKRFISTIEPRRNKMSVTRVHGRRIVAGMEVLWSYNSDAAKRANPNLYPQNEWQLVGVVTTVYKFYLFSPDGTLFKIISYRIPVVLR